MRSGQRSGVPDSVAFSQQLAALKQSGSNILVVGRTAPEAHAELCRLLVGDDGTTRRRLAVRTQSASVCGCDVAALDDPTTVVRWQSDVDPVPGSDAPRSILEDESLGALGAAVIDGVDDLLADAGEVTPGEIRLCLDSLGPLLADHEAEEVFRFLHMVTSRVRQVDGMGHVHLRVDRDSDHVILLEPLFDAVVEVRTTDETAEQRWHLGPDDVSTEWLQL